MNTKQVKSIPITSLLERLGFFPHHEKQGGNDVWYKSPFRPEEKDPSFHVNRAKNVWYDFGGGKGQGGSVLDLVMAIQNCSAGDALAYLEKTFNKGENLIVQSKVAAPMGEGSQKQEMFALDEIRRDFSPSLYQYIKQERKINIEAIREFAVQVHFHNQAGKQFFGVGIKNQSGGYEVRNPYFKGGVGAKDFAFIPGKSSESVSIFEGMFDFFSALTYYGKDVLMQNDVLILNSTAMVKRAVEFLGTRPECRTLKLYLDNDAGGQQAAEEFKAAFPDRSMEPCFALYLNHNDFNEFLIQRQKGRGVG